MKNIVVFDFDGTLSAKDSSLEFAKYCFKKSIRPWLFLPIVLLSFIIKIFFPKGYLWRELSRIYLTNNMIKKFSKPFIDIHLKERFGWAKEQVLKEKKTGNIVLLISAGPDFLIPYLVSDIPFDKVFSSKMNSKYPWKFDFLNWGEGKVKSLNNFSQKYNLISSYSDSKSDLPIMNLAINKIWINPKTGLRK